MSNFNIGTRIAYLLEILLTVYSLIKRILKCFGLSFAKAAIEGFEPNHLAPSIFKLLFFYINESPLVKTKRKVLLVNGSNFSANTNSTI